MDPYRVEMSASAMGSTPFPVLTPYDKNCIARLAYSCRRCDTSARERRIAVLVLGETKLGDDQRLFRHF